MLAILFGVLFIGCGLWGIVHWSAEFIVVLRGLVPVMLCCGGVLAVVAGISSMRDALEAQASRKDPAAGK